MAATRLTNVIVPDVWNQYMIERTAEQSALIQSGIMQDMADLNPVGEGGNVVNMPFWQDLTGEDEVLSATGAALGVNNITSEKDVAVILARGKAWGVNELAASLSGDDPAGAIANLVAAYWARRLQASAISVLQGIFGSATMSANVHDISAVSNAQRITAAGFIDAQQKLGDVKDRLTGVLMHSATEAELAKQNLIEFIQPSEGSARIRTFMGKPVVVDDTLPVSSGTYNTYLFGPGALGFANVTNSKVTMTETDRDSLAGEDYLINRRHFVVHPRGVKWAGSATGGGPANSDLATQANWSRVYEPRNVRVVLFRHALANSV